MSTTTCTCVKIIQVVSSSVFNIWLRGAGRRHSGESNHLPPKCPCLIRARCCMLASVGSSSWLDANNWALQYHLPHFTLYHPLYPPWSDWFHEREIHRTKQKANKKLMTLSSKLSYQRYLATSKFSKNIWYLRMVIYSKYPQPVQLW